MAGALPKRRNGDSAEKVMSAAGRFERVAERADRAHGYQYSGVAPLVKIWVSRRPSTPPSDGLATHCRGPSTDQRRRPPLTGLCLPLAEPTAATRTGAAVA